MKTSNNGDSFKRLKHYQYFLLNNCKILPLDLLIDTLLYYSFSE